MEKGKFYKGLIIAVIVCIIGITSYRPLIKYLVSQAANPRGIIGIVMTRIWSGYFTDLHQWGLSHIDLETRETVLDIGFGGGAGMQYIMEQYPDHTVYGIDISEEAVKTAASLNQPYIDNGSVILSVGDAAALPFNNNTFDLITAAQTHIYWDQLEIGLAECRRVLTDEGILLITCELDKINYHLPKYKDSPKFETLLYNIGYSNVKIITHPQYTAFIATK